jgi:cell division protein FtsB
MHVRVDQNALFSHEVLTRPADDRNARTARGSGAMKRKPAASRAGELMPRKRRNVVQSVLILIGCLVLGHSLIGERGWVASTRARREARIEQALLDRARAETIRLREQKRLLESDLPTIEDAVRRELGLIKPGEKLFIITDVPPDSTRQ